MFNFPPFNKVFDDKYIVTFGFDKIQVRRKGDNTYITIQTAPFWRQPQEQQILILKKAKEMYFNE